MAEIKIVYYGKIVDEIREPLREIASIFYPDSSYVDLPVMTDGYTGKAGVGDGKGYGRSIYATNVWGLGTGDGLIPDATTTYRLAWYHQAINKAIAAAEQGDPSLNTGVTLTVDDKDNAELLYWNQVAPALVDEGFYTKVGDNEYGKELVITTSKSTSGPTSGADSGKSSSSTNP